MTHEFQSKIYQTIGEMHEAIAFEWLSAGGLNDDRFRRQYLLEKADAELAGEAIYGLGIGENPQWAAVNGFTREALIDAFAKLRRDIVEDSDHK